MAVREIGVGLLGLGNVGAGVVTLLRENAAAIEARLGARLIVRGVCVRDLKKERLATVPEGTLTTDANAVIDDPQCEVVVELVGGDTFAKECVLRAIDNKKQVVTANKLLLAMHGETLFAKAAQAGCDLYFEAAVCGGLPIIRALREGLASDRITEIIGIVNGTSNFILSAMESEGRTFDEALAEAQASGFAESDPSLDVGGGDAAHKLAILTMLCFGVGVRPDTIHVEGIGHLSPIDFENAARFGYVIKPLAVAREYEGGLDMRVHAAMIPKRWMLAAVSGVYNAVYVSSQALGNSMYYGQGAGMMPTAVAVVSDIIDVSRNVLARTSSARALAGKQRFRELELRDVGLLRCRYYLRLSVCDQPGVLAELATILAKSDISIAQVVQEGQRGIGEPVTIIILTHVGSEKNMQAALRQVIALAAVAETCLLRILQS